MAVDPKDPSQPDITVFVSQLCEEIRAMKTRVNFLESQAVRAPGAEVVPALPVAASRVGKLLSFDAAGNPIASAPASGDVSEFALEIAARLKRDGSEAMLAELLLAGNAVGALGAVPKQQLDSAISPFRARNLVMNGDMQLNSYAVSSGPTGTYYLNRWKVEFNTTAVVAFSQATDAPASTRLLKSFRAQVTTAQAVLGINDFALMSQHVEGYNISELVGQTFTLSFWVRSSKVGKHCVAMRNAAGANPAARGYLFEYDVLVANTWEYKTVTVTGGLPTAGTWDYTNGTGLRLQWILAAGTNLQGAGGSWNGSLAIATASQVNALDTVGNIFAITGVQLEKSPIATAFNYPDPTQEGIRCMRYYEDCTEAVWANGVYATHYYKVVKRAVPTLTTSLPGGGYSTLVVTRTHFYGVYSGTNGFNWQVNAEL